MLEVLGADELLELLGAGLEELDVEEPVGDVGLFSQPIEAASPKVMAPPLRRRRKSRRSASALSASFSSIFSIFLVSQARMICKGAATRPSLIRKEIRRHSRPDHGRPSEIRNVLRQPTQKYAASPRPGPHPILPRPPFA